jgi:hypothetical protein
VTLIGPGVTYRISLTRLLLSHDPTAVDRARYQDRSRLDAEFAGMAKALGAQYISPYTILCPNHICLVRAENGAPMQWDQHHLSREGAAYVVDRFPEI